MKKSEVVNFRSIAPRREGGTIKVVNGLLRVPEKPVIPVIAGDGIGPEVTKVAEAVLDAAVEKAYGGRRRIVWLHVPAGEISFKEYGEWLPEDTVEAIRHHVVAIKGPLTTPVGGGIRSLNVVLRQALDLFACVRPVKWIRGVPCPVKNPEKLDIVIFRENTEDVYAGIEWEQGTVEARRVWRFLTEEMGVNLREDSGLGVKPISITGTKRLVRAAIKYALKNDRKSVTLVHKGNIMKFTEGAFRNWGYNMAKEEFREKIVTEEELDTEFGGKMPEGKILIKDRLADSMFQQILLRPEDYDVIATQTSTATISQMLARRKSGAWAWPLEPTLTMKQV